MGRILEMVVEIIFIFNIRIVFLKIFFFGFIVIYKCVESEI